jgi:hypothetical protein
MVVLVVGMGTSRADAIAHAVQTEKVTLASHVEHPCMERAIKEETSLQHWLQPGRPDEQLRLSLLLIVLIGRQLSPSSLKSTLTTSSPSLTIHQLRLLHGMLILRFKPQLMNSRKLHDCALQKTPDRASSSNYILSCSSRPSACQLQPMSSFTILVSG